MDESKSSVLRPDEVRGKREGWAHRLNYGNKCLAKFYFESNGRIEIYNKKINGKEVSHDRVKPLLRLFGQGVGGRPLQILHHPKILHCDP